MARVRARIVMLPVQRYRIAAPARLAPRIDIRIDHKGKVTLHRLQITDLKAGRVAPDLRGMGTSAGQMVKPTAGPLISNSRRILGCSSPNTPSTFFGPRQILPCRPGCHHAGAPRRICTFAGAPIADRIRFDRV